MRRYLWLLPLAGWLAGCGEASRELEPGAAVATRVAVDTVAVAAEQWPSMYEATGTVRARATAVVSSKWMGYVREVKVQVGDRVSAGQLLASLDARDLEAGSNRALAAREEIKDASPEADSGIAAAKSNLDLAQTTFRRMSELYGKKSISDQEFDETSAKLKAAQAAFEMARAKRTQLDSKLAQAEQEARAAEVTLSYAKITAPVSGVVTAKSIDPGNLAVPGAPLLTIESGGYRLEAAVEESRLPAIRVGQAASVTLDGKSGAIASRVSEIVPAVDAASRAYTVKIDLPAAPELTSGVFGRATFPLGMRGVTAIPMAAVIERGQLESVFVADNGVARTRLVTLGERYKDRAEVLSGLTPGERVIAPPPQGLTDGARIEVRP